MKKPDILLKLVVIAGFVLMVSGFVAFKSGFFSRSATGNYAANGTDYQIVNYIDSPPPNRSTISSSKSLIIAIDSSKVDPKRIHIDSFYIDEHLSSSKSARMMGELKWDSNYLKYLFADSVKRQKDSVKPKK